MWSLSVVTPTLRRPQEVEGLVLNLAEQTVLPTEIIVVDGAPEREPETEQVVNSLRHTLPLACRYIRHGGGTAIQRNVGIDAARGDFVAFVDDDVRLEPNFFSEIKALFDADGAERIGGVTGMMSNEVLDRAASPRWRWYRRLRLFTTYEPGRYDFNSGYPINRKLQPLHEGVREVDFMSTSSAVWRRRVFSSGLRFAPFFSDYGVLEDAHLALRAARSWKLVECGRARCIHLRSGNSRIDKRRMAWKSAVNYRYVFVDVVPVRTWKQEWRFWRVQAFDLLREALYALRSGKREDWLAVLGKAQGIAAAFRISSAEKASQVVRPARQRARAIKPD